MFSRCIILLALVSLREIQVNMEDISAVGAEYLHSAIRDIQKKNYESVVSVIENTGKPQAWPTKDNKHSIRIANALTTPDTDRSDQTIYQPPNHQVNRQGVVPSLSLTKGELIALYDAAISKGNTLNLNSPEGAQMEAAVHELPNTHGDNIAVASNNAIGQYAEAQTTSHPGYYYYYYPLKSFIDDIAYGHTEDHKQEDYGTHAQTLHSHTHHHNVKIEPINALMDTHPKHKALEPLFMAISGFVGMAVMFLFSMVFLPKFGNHKSRGVEVTKTQMVSLSSVVMEAIEGHDCSERIFCEAGKTVKALNLQDNRFTKFFQRLMPTSVAKSIERIRQQAQKKTKCNLIQCKRKKKNDNIIASAKLNAPHSKKVAVPK